MDLQNGSRSEVFLQRAVVVGLLAEIEAVRAEVVARADVRIAREGDIDVRIENAEHATGVLGVEVVIVADPGLDAAAVEREVHAGGGLIRRDLKRGFAEVNVAAAGVVDAPALDGAFVVGEAAVGGDKVRDADVEYAVAVHDDGTGAERAVVGDVDGTLIDDDVAGEGRAGSADVKVAVTPLREALTADELGDAEAGADAVGEVGSAVAVSGEAARCDGGVHVEHGVVRDGERAGGEDAASAGIRRDAEEGILCAVGGRVSDASGLLDFEVGDAVDAVVGGGVPIERGIVHGDDAAGGVGVVQQRIGRTRAEEKRGGGGVAAVEHDLVAGDGITGGAEGLEVDRAFVDDPAAAVTLTDTARGIALVIGDIELASAILGDAAGGDVAVDLHGAAEIEDTFVGAREAEFEIRVDGEGVG